MKIKIAIVTVLAIGLASCGSEEMKTANHKEDLMPIETDLSVISSASKGQELMNQKCFICHFKTPDPSRKNQMIAPPMLRVQEHYKPAFPEKNNFVAAVMAMVNNPSEENTLMPGAIRKFNVMPKVEYDQKELKLIAETLFDMDFESSNQKSDMHDDGIALNDGAKWKLKEVSMNQINTISKDLSNFKSNDLSNYNKLGKDIFDGAKKLLADDSYDGEKFEQIHNFFHGVENNMHTLMATKSIDEAKALVSELQVKYKDFDNYFEKE